MANLRQCARLVNYALDGLFSGFEVTFNLLVSEDVPEVCLSARGVLKL